jgi:hypothetical protein
MTNVRLTRPPQIGVNLNMLHYMPREQQRNFRFLARPGRNCCLKTRENMKRIGGIAKSLT